MNHRSKYLFKNIGILTISNFASKILVFLLVPLYTSVLSTSECGVYDIVVSTVTLLFPLLTCNIVDAVMRFSMDKTCSKNEIATIGIKYVLSSSLIVGLFSIFASQTQLIPQFEGVYAYFFLYYVFYTLNQFFIQFSKGLEKVNLMGIAGVISTIIMILANIYFLIILKAGLNGFFIANILSLIVPVIFYFISLKFWIYIKSIKCSSILEKEMLKYCTPLIFTALGWWINSTADKYAVTILCGIAANGVLSVSYKIPSIINTIQGVFTQAWQISAIKEYGEKNVAVFYGKTFLYLNFVMTFSCSLLILITRPLAYILYAKDFYIAWKYVPILLVCSVINSASGFIGPILSAKKASKEMACSAIWGAIVNIFLNILLIYIIGIQGATIATLVSSTTIYVIRKKAVKKEMVIRKYWKVIFSWVLLIIQSIIEISELHVYMEAIIILLVIITNSEVILELFNSLRQGKNSKKNTDLE